MSATREPSSPATVLLVGPEPTMIGGMAGVMGQILNLDFDGRYRIECVPVTMSSGIGESIVRRVARHVRQLWVLRRAIRRTGAAVVHIHTCSGSSFYRSVLDMWIARWTGARVALHVHGAAFDEFYEQAGAIARRFIESSLSRADCVIALSDGWRRKLQSMSPAARIAVVENAIELPETVAERRHDGPCRFLMLARMDEWKGVDDLLDACALLRADGLVVEVALAGPPGTAGDQAVLNQKIRDRDLDGAVRYIGSRQGVEKTKLFEWADAYVQPSRHEGMPLSLLEALAYGLAVVATRVGAVPEVIDDRLHGLLVPPGDPGQLARAMRELATDEGPREAMSRAGRDLVRRRFSLARFRRDLVSLYDSLVLAPRFVVSRIYA
ncbi:MAG: glycosyltransferase family 4 protein [Planctomycetota bacterium]